MKRVVIMCPTRPEHVLNNPLGSTDSTGHCQDTDTECLTWLEITRQVYGAKIDDGNKLWSTEGLLALGEGLRLLRDSGGGDGLFNWLVNDVTFGIATEYPQSLANRMWYLPGQNRVEIDPAVLPLHDYVATGIVHEVGGHHWDWKSGDGMSKGMAAVTGSKNEEDKYLWFVRRVTYNPGKQPPPTEYGGTNMSEDWAESVSASVRPDQATVADWTQS